MWAVFRAFIIIINILGVALYPQDKSNLDWVACIIIPIKPTAASVPVVIVDSRQFKEVGYLEGWTASSGDKITLEWNGVVKMFNIP